MPKQNILLILADPNLGLQIENSTLRPAGYEVTLVAECQTAEFLIKSNPPDFIFIGEQLRDGDGFDLAARLMESAPHIPVVFIASRSSEGLAVKAIRAGCADYLVPPVRSNDVLQAIERCQDQKKQIDEWINAETRRITIALRKRLDSLEALQQIGRTVTATLDLDKVLKSVVDAAVELTGAEEGSLLLLDETTGELYMRAARNFQDEFVHTFRLPIRDTLAGQVLRTGLPVTLDEKTPQKIKTSYLVHTLTYVPLQVHGRVIGVLGVDNRQTGHAFSEDQITFVSALADYAAIAIENARFYERSEVERTKLETILTKIGDGVIVVGHDGRLILVNHIVQEAFELGDQPYLGKTVRDVFHHADILEIFDDIKIHPSRTEISLDDGRVFNVLATPIYEVGLAVTMQDITHLKELDRIKSDFVNTVSHDLRSPLTAILGYVELIERAGQINEQQREFIRRVQFSVNNITTLINDLLDLGRIEAGFDSRKEVVHLPAIIQYTIDGLRNRIAEKKQELVLDVPEKLPTVLGNPVRLRQLYSNLVSNAIKFTPAGGLIGIRARAEGGQIIFQVVDNGPGIPPADQPYIFDKFYRGSNVPFDTPGTGLGLAIVKSIVDNHQGRIWVDSAINKGTTFTVVLPVMDQEI